MSYDKVCIMWVSFSFSTEVHAPRVNSLQTKKSTKRVLTMCSWKPPLEGFSPPKFLGIRISPPCTRLHPPEILCNCLYFLYSWGWGVVTTPFPFDFIRCGNTERVPNIPMYNWPNHYRTLTSLKSRLQLQSNIA